MSEQQSQKRGLRSEAQKEDAARDAYEPMPATSEAGGAFGKREDGSLSDRDLALSLEEKRIQQER
jgi:hypothetical protein